MLDLSRSACTHARLARLNTASSKLPARSSIVLRGGICASRDESTLHSLHFTLHLVSACLAPRSRFRKRIKRRDIRRKCTVSVNGELTYDHIQYQDRRNLTRWLLHQKSSIGHLHLPPRHLSRRKGAIKRKEALITSSGGRDWKGYTTFRGGKTVSYATNAHGSERTGEDKETD